MVCERIHPRHNKGDRRLLSAPQGSSGKDSKGEIVCRRRCWGTVVKGESEEVWEHMECFSFLWYLFWGVSNLLVS